MKKYTSPAIFTIVTMLVSGVLGKFLYANNDGPMYSLLPFVYKIKLCTSGFPPIICNHIYLWWGILLCIVAWVISFSLFVYFKKATVRVILLIILIGIFTFVTWSLSGKYDIKPSSYVPASQSNQIENWQTYSNTEYGIEFQYPTDWKLKEKIDTGNNVRVLNVFVSNTEYREDQYYWSLDQGQSLFMVNATPKNDILPWGMRKNAEQNFMLGKVSAHKGPYELTDGGPGTGNPTALEISAYKNDVEYVINLVPPTGPSDQIFNQMLASFKFTK